MKVKRYAPGLAAGSLLLAMALPAHAQVDDARWLAFMGCWEPLEAGADAGFLCFTPASGGVEMASVVDGAVVASEHLVSDGQPRAIVAEGCEGTESVSFSSDGIRAFTRTELVCGDESRSGTGVMALIAPNRWVDVRTLEVQGERVAWIQEYMLLGIDRLAEQGMTEMAPDIGINARAARTAAAQAIDLDDVTEAAALMDTEGVVVWVASQRDRLQVDGGTIVEMADAGVPEEIIDVVVAVSYPERFVVAPEQEIAEADRRVAGRRVPIGIGYRGYMRWDPFYRYGYSPYGYGYSPFGYGYSPYGYGYRPWGSGITTTIRVERAPSGGRLINGRGFSSGRSPSGRTAVRGGGSSGGGPAASSGGGGSRTSTGRTARRRGGS